MFCTKCGAKNSDESKFCFNCGSNLAIKVTHEPNTSPAYNSKPYISPYEDEETIFSIRGLNLPEKRVFPKDKKDIPLLNSPDCDIFYTNRRVCLTLGDPNIKEPAPTKWFIPVGGAVGAVANFALREAINGYRGSQFKKKNGTFYEPAEIDIMCLAGNAIYSKGLVKVEIFKDKAGFFNTIGNEPKYMNIAFTSDYQYQDRIIKGSIINAFAGDVNGWIKTLKKLSLANIEILNLHRNDVENVKYIASKLK